VLAFWQFGTSARVRFFSSTPSAIAGTIRDWVVDGSLWIHLGATLAAMVVGYAIGCLLGIVLGLVLGFLPRARRVLQPYISGLYALPKIALAPLFVIAFGIELNSKIALVAITVLFLLLTSTLDGFRDVDGDLVTTLRLMGATTWESTRKVVLPAIVPWIFTGMRISVRYAFTATLLAELIAANRGLGFLIQSSSGKFDATGAYAAIVILIAFSIVITEALSAVERRMDYRVR
jgi:NitT/TauT family transport system permease protein